MKEVVYDFTKIKRQVEEKFSNKKAFFIAGLAIGVLTGATYGMIGISAWFDANRLVWRSPVEVRFFAPVAVEKRNVPQAGESATPTKSSSLDAPHFVTTAEASTSNEVYDYLCKVFGKNCDLMWKVAKCESGRVPTRVNWNSLDFGLLQINEYWHAARFTKMYGVAFRTGSLDYKLNIDYAKFLFDHSGLGPWSASKHCWSKI